MIVFTICSNNYLPMARILGESIQRVDPRVRFIIGLIDLPDPTVNYDAFASFEILPVHQIDVPDLEGMAQRYSIVELNTAAKPFYFHYLFQRHADEKGLKICYIDPDIAVYSSLQPVEEALESSTVMLTPHALIPIDLDDKHPGENTFLNFGIYNLGFCGMRRSKTADEVLKWWSERLINHCRIDVKNGIFVDQLWMNLVPIFFEDIHISKHPGLNVAYWNFHERRIEKRGEIWYVNERWPLVFFHFSDLSVDNPDLVTKTPTRITLKERPESIPLFHEYRTKLIDYEIERFKRIPCAYVEKRKEWLSRERRAFRRKHPVYFLLATLKRLLSTRLRGFLRSRYTLPSSRS